MASRARKREQLANALAARARRGAHTRTAPEERVKVASTLSRGMTTLVAPARTVTAEKATAPPAASLLGPSLLKRRSCALSVQSARRRSMRRLMMRKESSISIARL